MTPCASQKTEVRLLSNTTESEKMWFPLERISSDKGTLKASSVVTQPSWHSEKWWKSHCLRTPVQSLPWSLASCVTLDKSLHLISLSFYVCKIREFRVPPDPNGWSYGPIIPHFMSPIEKSYSYILQAQNWDKRGPRVHWPRPLIFQMEGMEAQGNNLINVTNSPLCIYELIWKIILKE